MTGLRTVRAIASLIGLALILWTGSTLHSASPRVVTRIVIDGGITDSTRDYLVAALRHAEQRRAQALVIEMDTPGGLLDATRAIVQEILKAKVPVVTFVAPEGARAGSAGLFITLASHVAAMAPSTNIGAAHPVSLFGDTDQKMDQKVANDAAALARSLAETRGRDSAAAEKAVKESASFTSKEAIESRLVDLGAANLGALLNALEGRRVVVHGAERVLSTRGAEVETFERSGRQALFDWLANPVLLYVLLLLGILGIYIEFQSPGLLIPGLVGAVCLGIVFGLQVLPINTFGALLIGLGAVLLFAEAYITSFGLLSLGGLACLVVGSYMLFDVPGSTFRLRATVIWSVAITFAAVLLFIAVQLLRAKRQGPTSGVEALIGTHALVSESIGATTGKVFFDGTYWNATSGVPVEKGATVRIDGIEGLRVRVSPLGQTDVPPAEGKKS